VIDILVVLAYLGGMVGIGAYFARKQVSTDAYFAGGRSVPAWAVGLSILATLISSVTFLAYPGEGYAGNWIRLVQGLMVPVALLAIVWWLVPLYRHVIQLSAYEYFERRFSYGVRLYSSLAFTLMHFSKMGTVFFLLALALAKMTGYNTYHVLFVIGVLTVLYTLVGGIEGVVWSDVVQGFILVSGGLVCTGVLLFAPEASPGAIISNAFAQGKMSLSHADPNVSWLDFTKLTTLVMALNGIFYAIQKYGTDQTIVQRFLLAKNDKLAIKAALGGALLCVPVWTLFMFIGTLLWSFYQTAPLPAGTRPDAVFPYFIMTELPPGVTGIILAALCAAAMSSLSSDLNSLAAVGVEDYYRRFRPQATDKQCLNAGRWIVAVSGVFAIAVAMGYVAAEGKNALAVVFGLYAIFSGGIAGLFALAFFTPRANRGGAYAGIAACVLFTAWAVLSSGSFPIGGFDLHLDLGRFNFTHHSYMVGVYSHIVLFVVGYLASFVTPHEPRAEELTYWGWKRRKVRMDAAA
jgi:SSS family solute:Na+ symporter